MKLTCRICGGRLEYAGRGAIPEQHVPCRTLANDLTRVERALKAAWSAEAEGVQKNPLRKWLVGEMFRLANEVTASAIQRKPAATALQRLERLISSLRRTRDGREALRRRGIEEGVGVGIVREE